MTPIETLMRHWLAAGTPAQRQHARARIARGFAAVAHHVAAGLPTVDDATYAARLAVCESCPNLVRPAWTCGGATGCGCHLKVKARWAEQRCPLGKWPR